VMLEYREDSLRQLLFEVGITSLFSFEICTGLLSVRVADKSKSHWCNDSVTSYDVEIRIKVYTLCTELYFHIQE
jgi:hypothetical protein